MKSFFQFISESPNTVRQATRMGLKSDGHGGWYDNKGEFIAKTKQGELLFYNKRQKRGQDSRQTEREKRLSFTTYAPVTSSYDYNTIEYETELRELYVNKKIFNEGEWVKSSITENIGKIIRRGTNYLICVTEDGEMFKSWIKDVYESKTILTDVSGVSAEKRLVGTDDHRKYVETMVPGNEWGKQFINKYRKK
jgi:hypothetical protein